MNSIINAFLHHNIRVFVESIGYIGVFGVIFAESGLLIGFFLPGDSMIFTAGLLASSNFAPFNIWKLLIGAWIAAILGDNLGYEFGKRIGPRLFTRGDSFLFHKKNLIRAQQFYDKHGGKAIVLARFMPVVRTFAPIVAGIGKMNHKRFTLFNFVGGSLWVWILGLGGYFLGNVLPNADKYLIHIIIIIVLFSVLPPAIHLYKENKTNFTGKIKEKLLILLQALKFRLFK